ncbi:hypothetical protein TTRE_0000065301 [Trichuris trichiura]|uniref:Uncharacterized protein n=1 Tax=Trichuris trichiura TaxID=36087 RepID=A0A077YX94_TRITR|nr:hypothetical protein TTRE_0000065301 [Trichuris trichiura]
MRRGSNASGSHGVEKPPARQFRVSLKSLRGLGSYLRRNWNSVFDFSTSTGHRLSSSSGGSSKASRPALPSKEQLQQIETNKLHVRNTTSLKGTLFQATVPWSMSDDRVVVSTASLTCQPWPEDSNYKTVTLDTPVAFVRPFHMTKVRTNDRKWFCKQHAYVNFSGVFGDNARENSSNGTDHFSSQLNVPIDENYRTMPLNVPLTFALAVDKKLNGNAQGKLVIEAS